MFLWSNLNICVRLFCVRIIIKILNLSKNEKAQNFAMWEMTSFTSEIGFSDSEVCAAVRIHQMFCSFTHTSTSRVTYSVWAEWQRWRGSRESSVDIFRSLREAGWQILHFLWVNSPAARVRTGGMQVAFQAKYIYISKERSWETCPVVKRPHVNFKASYK